MSTCKPAPFVPFHLHARCNVEGCLFQVSGVSSLAVKEALADRETIHGNISGNAILHTVETKPS